MGAVKRIFPALVLLSLGCTHVQEEGDYAFVAEEVLRDDCGILTSPEMLWDGTLRVDGEVVRMRYDLFDMELRGNFRDLDESFFLDGTAANVTAPVAGQECLFDLVNVSLRADTADANTFTGTVSVDYVSDREDRCECELWTRFRATRVQ